jgi:hypothetical protein
MYGRLVYGIDLGGGRPPRWEFALAGDDTTWFDPQSSAREFAEQATTRLLRAHQLTDEDLVDKGDTDRRALVHDHTGVTLVPHGIGNVGMLLVAYENTVEEGEWDELDLAGLAAEPTRLGWDAALTNALSILGLQPTRPQPSWFLCAGKG